MSGCIPANPDVTGIGIRLNLYVTMLVIALVPDIPKCTSPLLEAVAGNAGLTGLSFLITAIVKTPRGELSLYHAIFIIHILYFTGIMAIPAGHYKRSALTRRAVVGGLLSYGSFLMFTGYAFYVWASAPTFGGAKPANMSQCNAQIKYIFFFRPVQATAAWLRKLWMVGLGLSLAILLVFPAISCVHVCTRVFKGTHAPQNTSDENSSKLFRTIFQVSKVLATIYGIIMLELYERANKNIVQSGDGEWTFGQTFAVAQLFGTLNEVLHWAISYCAPDSADGSEAASVTLPQSDVPMSGTQNWKTDDTLSPGGRITALHFQGSSSRSSV